MSLRGLLLAAVSELGNRVAMGAAVVVGLVGGVVVPPARVLVLGFLAAVVIALVLDAIRRFWDYRREPYSVRTADVILHFADRARRVTFQRRTTIRCKLPNLAQMKFLYSWDGETILTPEDIRPLGDGFTLDVMPSGNQGRIIARFDPLRKWRSKKIGYSMSLTEPHLTYTTGFQYSATHMSSIFSRLTFRVTWDESVNIDAKSIRVREYRTPWDQKEKGLAELTESACKPLKHTTGVEWQVRGITPNRTYTLMYTLPGVGA